MSKKRFRLKPSSNFLTIIPIEFGEKKTDSGLIIAQKEKERPQLAKIVDVGPGARTMLTGEKVPLDYEPGQIVAINKFSAIKIEFEDQSYTHIIGEGDILGVVVSEDVEEG